MLNFQDARKEIEPLPKMNMKVKSNSAQAEGNTSSLDTRLVSTQDLMDKIQNELQQQVSFEFTPTNLIRIDADQGPQDPSQINKQIQTEKKKDEIRINISGDQNNLEANAEVKDDPFDALQKELASEIDEDIVRKSMPRKAKKKQSFRNSRTLENDLLRKSLSSIGGESSEEIKSITPQQTISSTSNEEFLIDPQTPTPNNTPLDKIKPHIQEPMVAPRILMRKTSSVEQKRKPLARIQELKDEDIETSQFDRELYQSVLVRTGSIRSVNTMNKTSKDLIDKLKSNKNQKLQFLLSVIDLLQLPQEDPKYLQVVLDAFNKSQDQLFFEKQTPESSPNQQTLNKYRKRKLADALTSKCFDLSPTQKLKQEVDDNMLVQDVLLHVCQQLVLRNKQMAQKQSQHTGNLFKHEMKLKEIEKIYFVEQMRLHFTFMFACPLVMSLQQRGKTELKQIPQLNYTKEFNIIKDKMIESKLAIRYQKKQCTIESLQDVLSQKPLGMHFSGHGIQNTQKLGDQFFEENKGKGDFLLLETSDGDAQLVSRERLKEIVNKAKCNLEFVIVLTCHSQFVGEIFLQAGTKHVICIQQESEVEDDAAMTFTDTFYRSIFQQNMEICRAFEFARQNVGIKHGEEQENMFLLLIHDKTQPNCLNALYSVIPGMSVNINQKGEKHICQRLPFGKIMNGGCTDTGIDKTALNRCSRSLGNFIGRYKEMYQIINKLMMPVSGKIYTVWGQHGVGKTALVQAVMHYVNERNLIKGGFSFISANGVTNCEVFLRKLNLQLVKDNSHLFGSTKDYFERQNKDVASVFHLIISQISQLEKMVVFVIDSCEGLIANDKQFFKQILQLIVSEISQCNIIITSTMRIKDANEELIQVDGLELKHAFNLFLKHANRVIELKEQNALLQYKLDLQKYPELKFEKPKKLKDHHLFTLIGGNPQSILLFAPMLRDPDQHRTLVDLYKLLTSEEMTDMLQKENINSDQNMTASMRMSIEAAFTNISENDPEALDLFFIVSMYPGGLLIVDLDQIWAQIHENKIMERQFKNDEEDLKIIDVEERTWKRAYFKLRDSKMINLQFQSNNETIITSCEEDEIKNDNDEQIDEYSILIMPIYLRNYAQCSIDASFDQRFSKIEAHVAQHLLKCRMEFYRKIKRADFANSKKDAEKQLNKYKYHGQVHTNMTAFFERMLDKYMEYQSENKSSAQPADEQEGMKFSFLSDSCTLDDQMSDIINGVIKLQSSEKSQISKLNDQETSDEGENQFTQKVKQCFLRSRLSSTKEVFKQDKQKEVNEHMAFVLQSLRSESQMSKAKRRWRWAFNKIMESKKVQRTIEINAIKIGNDSDDDEEKPQIQKTTNQLGERMKKAFLNKLQQQQTKLEMEILNNRRSFYRKKQIKINKKLTMYKTMKSNMINVKQEKPEIARLKVGTKLSMGDLSEDSDDSQKRTAMNIDEFVAVFHIADLYLVEMYEIAVSIIEQQLYKLNLCSQLFHGNIAKLYALCLQTIFFQKFNKFMMSSHPNKPTKEDLEIDYKKITNAWEKAVECFEDADCDWGTGLIKYQEAQFYEQLLSLDGGIVGLSEKGQIKQQKLLEIIKRDKIDLINKTVKTYAQAYQQFNKIKHLRGIALSVKGLMDNWGRLLQIQGREVNMEQSDENDSFSEDSFSSSDSELEQQDKKLGKLKSSQIKNNIFKLKKLYMQSIRVFYQEQSVKERDSLITRKQGEEYSLLLEIAKSSSIEMLYKKITRQLHPVREKSMDLESQIGKEARRPTKFGDQLLLKSLSHPINSTKTYIKTFTSLEVLKEEV